jgi:uncharacterized membrane protein YfcA
MLVGATIGGWTAGFLIRELDPRTLRWIIVGLGTTMGAVMVVRTYF